MECLTIWVLINWLLTLNTFYSLSCWTKNSQHFWVSKVVLIKSHLYTTFINELSFLLATDLVQGSAYSRVRRMIHWQGDSGSRGSLGSFSTSRQNVCNSDVSSTADHSQLPNIPTAIKEWQSEKASLSWNSQGSHYYSHQYCSLVSPDESHTVWKRSMVNPQGKWCLHKKSYWTPDCQNMNKIMIRHILSISQGWICLQ